MICNDTLTVTDHLTRKDETTAFPGTIHDIILKKETMEMKKEILELIHKQMEDVNPEDIKVSYELDDRITELKKDINDYGSDAECLLIFEIVTYSLFGKSYAKEIPTDYLLIGEGTLEDAEFFLKDTGVNKWKLTTLNDVLVVFEELNKIV